MKKIIITFLFVAMVVCLALGAVASVAADTDLITAKVTAFDMRQGANFPWQASAEDEYAVFTGSTDLNTGETNNVILQVNMPVAGQVSFADGGTVVKITSNQGDGARVRMICNDRQIYPTGASWQEIKNDGTQVVIKPSDFEVEQGDKLYLVFDNGGNFSNASDSVWFCLGFKLNGNWFGSNEYWYTNADEGEATVEFAGVTCKKNELVEYKYGYVSDNMQSEAVDEGNLATADTGILVPTFYDEGETRFKGTENQSCQFEKIGMNVVAGTPNLIAMEMSADGVFDIQNSYLKTFNNAAAKAEVIKNDKVVYTQSDIGSGAYATLDSAPAIGVAQGDVIYVRITSEAGAYLRCMVNGVLASSEGVVNYSTLETVLNGGGNCLFYTSKNRDPLGEITDKTLKTVQGVDDDLMIFSNADQRWGGRETYCLIWKEASGLKVHTGSTYSPAIGYSFTQGGKAQIADLSLKVESNASDGIRFRILIMSGGAEPTYRQLYPLDAAWEIVLPGADITALSTEIVPVEAGDCMIVVVNQNNTNSNDQTDVKFDVVFQPNGGEVAVYSAVSGYTTDKNGAWRYSDMTVATDYSSTVVGEAEARSYTSLDKNKMIFEEMTYFPTLARWGIAGRSFLQIENGSMHPGEIYAAAIGIKMPAKGRVDISDTVFKYDLHAEPDAEGDKSDGVRIRVLRNNDVIWPTDGSWQELNDGAEKIFDIPVFEVNEGDTIYVIVDCGANGKNNYDLTYVSIIAHFAEDGSDWTNTFDSKASFVETDPNYDSFSYLSYYYDTNGGNNSGNDGETGNNPANGDDPAISVSKKGCGGNIGYSALALSFIALGSAVFGIAKKRS